MKLSTFGILIILSLVLAFAASRCIVMGEKLGQHSEPTNKLAVSKGELAKKIEAGDISVTKEQLVSYLSIAEEVEHRTNDFIYSQSEAWNKLGILLGIIAIIQGITIVIVYVKSKSSPSNKT